MASISHGRLTETADHGAGWIPETETERAAIRDQLHQIVTSFSFINSKRCASLLKFVVDSALQGDTEHLKERTLGVDVFHRVPDYDTNHDPVVRTTAVEVRKRLAQYYAAPEHEREMRIAIPPGSYVPEFRLPPLWAPIAPVETAAPQIRDRVVLRKPLALTILALMILAATIGLWLYGGVSETGLDRFWKPIVNSPGAVLLVIGGPGPADSPRDGGAPVSVRELQEREQVAFADASTLSRITGVMMTKGKPFHIRRHDSAKLADLRDGPVVLIGAFNNEWTIRLADQVRYRFVRDPGTRVTYIQDRDNPTDRTWVVDPGMPYRDVKEDYAMVSRFLEPTTGRLVVTAAGITKFGTAAAGEFLSEPSYLAQALKSAPKDWEHKNLEILIATTLVGESSGPPRVVATYFW